MEHSKSCLMRQAIMAAGFMLGYHFVYQYFFGNPKKRDNGIPEDCPGIDNAEAGLTSTCQGCPNQQKCASGEMQAEQSNLLSSVSNNLSNVGTVILVMSGKGGVGKSTIATQLAFMLSENHQVGLLDIDLTGPSVPGMTKTEHEEVFESASGWTPVYISERLSVISIGHLLKDFNKAVVWRGPKKGSLIKQFLTGVDWGHLDYLVIDCPPGTSDEHITICNLLQSKNPICVLVTTPQKRCIDDVVRSAHFCHIANMPIVALVENMTKSIFDSSTRGNAQDLCKQFKIKNVLKLHMQQDIVTAGEEGRPLSNFDCLRPLESYIKNYSKTL
ncbi:Cytosolic Fe-S cluster assembly factor NUBP1 family protein [Babesia bovis T2Bo]|uniref:Nucleotide-binding protein 1, putative n=1 Tax=Babesia bovis TaxID=5865 RepID=A7AVK0_BABBO|nr:Cytosolic Fe-S cluster assembly factor NUBP1 family protein [Babesia bovis T2Bo]EDO05826.1 Cytosolic Fe-S cluster assembly factor NUBP1 family protein [Babesia bovis T2Bo]|eukprot:XP_001609394.1 nucleotide-binding protein 1 [Babesia bovis T2Bo]